MSTFTSQLTRNAAALVAVIGLLAFAGTSTVQAGLFGTAPLTGDADSGISGLKSYTHAIDTLGDEPDPFLINGVQFTAGGTSGADAITGAGYTTTGFTNPFPGHGNGVGGNIGLAMENFFFTGTAPTSVTLTDLTPGDVYKTVFYTSDGFGGQEQTISFSDTGQIETDVNRAAGRIEYTYKAPAIGEMTYTFTPEEAGSFHLYAFTNEDTKLLSIDDLFNTGVDASGNALGDGIDDPHWELVVDPSGLGDATVPNGFPIPPWIANDADSRWIGPDAGSANAPEGVYVYETTFTLESNANLNSVLITGDWTSDNNGLDIVLNGNSLGITNLGNFGSLNSFSIDGSNGFFNLGVNTLQFVVNNAPSSNNPTGLRIDNIFGTYSIVPEPTTATLALLGTIGLVSRRRRNAAA